MRLTGGAFEAAQCETQAAAGRMRLEQHPQLSQADYDEAVERLLYTSEFVLSVSIPVKHQWRWTGQRKECFDV